MYDPPPRRRISLIQVKLGPAHTYIYIGLTRHLLSLCTYPVEAMRVEHYPLQDIGSLHRFSVGVHHPLIAPPTCKAYPIAILLHDYRAIYDPPPTPLLYAMHYTILGMAISCKGQVEYKGPQCLLPPRG